jgi:hypothetical protein
MNAPWIIDKSHASNLVPNAFTSVSSDHEIFAHVNLALSLFENYRESMV